MYLALLADEEKQLFLRAAVALSRIDGDFAAQEEEMLIAYCEEMSVSSKTAEWQNVDIDRRAVIDKIAAVSGAVGQKIILFEMIGLAMVDGSYDRCEADFINEAAQKFNLSTEYVARCEKLLGDYLQLQGQISELVLE